jgi:hypothetical protein
MEREDRDAEALRRRLYRQGASPADLAEYLQVAEPPETPVSEDDPAPPPTTGPPLRPFVIAGAVVAAAALLGAALLTSRPAAPAARPVAAAPTAVTTQEPDGSWTITFSPAQILDSGPITHAEGTATQEGSQMYRYLVTTGDTVPGIADRFGICQADVTDALPYGADPAQLADGQGLELSRSESNEC